MLAKLSVILGFFVAASLGQAPDCNEIPLTKATCCTNIIEDPAEEETTQCIDENEADIKSVLSSCVMNTCIMKKKNLLDSDNKINKAVFTKYIERYLKEFSPSVEISLEKCVAETETSECISHTFLGCFYNALTKECPSTLWLKTEECTNLKKFYVDCPNANIYNWTK